MVVLAEGTSLDALSELDGLVAVDFLLQHPPVLERFAPLSERAWASMVLPSTQEAQSSEEAFLRWKRSVAGRVVVPMLRRLIGRGLVERRWAFLALTPSGAEATQKLTEVMAPDRRRRAAVIAAQFRANPDQAHENLHRALTGDRR